LPLCQSDGGYGYDSTDMAAVEYRLKDLQRDWVIAVTDAGQVRCHSLSHPSLSLWVIAVTDAGQVCCAAPQASNSDALFPP